MSNASWSSPRARRTAPARRGADVTRAGVQLRHLCLPRHRADDSRVARGAVHVRWRRPLLGANRDPPRGAARPTRPAPGALPAGKPGRAATDRAPSPRGHEGVRDPAARAPRPGGVRERVRRQLQTGADSAVTTRPGPGQRRLFLAPDAPAPGQSVRRLTAPGLAALANLVQLVRRMAGLLVHGGNGFLVRACRKAEDLSRLRIQPVARVLNPGTLLGFEIFLVRVGELLRSDVHPFVAVHERRHITSYSA